eukprot:CAMPEP_0168557720 /NCGR_PEP_ID=MMETSP0413-20121227/9577_1 /TAXON_ID=136452 /ORGANISM="Filamoeba nolandi, Strain NC-AS-23-1" /LENGTH=336 /DNA_ID=CAMNT_0008588773 /DNA_START=29 /DNA_END=1036 /DNA_ORIENTATION=+
MSNDNNQPFSPKDPWRNQIYNASAVSALLEALVHEIARYEQSSDQKGTVLPLAMNLAQIQQINFLIMGPARSGKSTLIKAITGQNVPKSNGWDSHTQKLKDYTTGKVRWWDSPGIEDWKTDELQVWKKTIQELPPKDRPLLCVFVVKATGSVMNSEKLSQFATAVVWELKMPLYFIITDVFTKDSREIAEMRNTYKQILSAFGSPQVLHLYGQDPNIGCDGWQLCQYGNAKVFSAEVNSEEKHVCNLRLQPCGIGELVGVIFQNLDAKQCAAFLVAISNQKSSVWSMLASVLQHVSIETLRIFLPPQVLDDVASTLLGTIVAESYQKIRNSVSRDW